MNTKTTRQVLIVEDSPVQTAFLRRFIEKEGFTATAVQNGSDALQAMRQRLPDLVLADVNMPIMSGFELCRAVKRDPALRQVPLILLTTLNDPRDLLEGLAAGADAYIFKPFVEDDLRARIETLLGQRGAPGAVDAAQAPIEFAYGGSRFTIAASRERVLNFLIIVYENAQRQNKELREMQLKLQETNRTLAARSYQLEAAKARYEALLRNTRTGFFRLSQGRFVECNPALAELLGYADAAALGEVDVASGVFADDTDYAALAERFAQVDSVTGVVVGLRRRDGQTVVVEANIRKVLDAKGDTAWYEGFLNDITERKRAELETQAHLEEVKRMNAYLSKMNARLEQTRNQLWQAEKLAAVGQLAAGVAHEINNPVGFIRSNLTTLGAYIDEFLELVAAYERQRPKLAAQALQEIDAVRAKVGIDFLREDVQDLIRESVQGTERVAKIVQDLREFSHLDSNGEWIKEDLHAGLDRTLDMLHPELKGRCEIRKEYGELPPVECGLRELNQVFLTLLVNAVQASYASGVVSIRTRPAGEEVLVEVCDNGSGIAPDHLDRIFDPFFTTKPVGQGTGLGLSVARSVVGKHHGRMEVQSAVGQGSTFRVFLPIRQRHAQAGEAVKK